MYDNINSFIALAGTVSDQVPTQTPLLLVAEPSTTDISPTEANVDEHCCNGDGVHPNTTHSLVYGR